MKFNILIVLLGFCFFLVFSESIELLTRGRIGARYVNNSEEVKNQLKTLESLGLVDLLKRSQSSKVLSTLAVDVFKRNFASKTIGFHDSLEQTVQETNKSVLMNDFKLFTVVLQKFGHLIKNIEINYDDIDMDQSNEISELLAEHCSNSLISMELIQWDKSALKIFKIPFTSVQNLTIHGDLKLKSSAFYNPFSKKAMKLNKMFPELRQLNLNHMFVSMPSVLGVKFPALETVSIIFFPQPFNEPRVDYFTKTKPAMESLFANNPHIRRLSLSNCNSFDYLKIASNHLLNLEQIDVDFVPLKEHDFEMKIAFPNVKKLQVKMSKRIDFFKTSSFGQLKELNLLRSGSKCNSLPLENLSLTNLTIHGFSLQYGKLLEFNEKTPNLEELLIASESKIDANSIVEYLKGNQNLKKLTFSSSDQILFDVLSKWIQGWKLSRDEFSITLEKVKVTF